MSIENRKTPFLAATAIAVVVFLQVPVLVVVLAAFSKTAYLTIPPKGLTLHWFDVVLRDPEYLGAAWTSLWLAAAATAAALVLGLVAGGLFAFITSLDNVPVSVFLLSASQTTLPVKIFTSVEQGVDPSVAAVSTLLIVTTGVVLLLAERWTGFHKHV